MQSSMQLFYLRSQKFNCRLSLEHHLIRDEIKQMKRSISEVTRKTRWIMVEIEYIFYQL